MTIDKLADGPCRKHHDAHGNNDCRHHNKQMIGEANRCNN